MDLPDQRTDPGLVATADEGTAVRGYLDFFRDTIEWKCAGMDDAELRWPLAPSTMTLAGLLSHLSFVEDYWLQSVWLGEAPSEPWRSAPWRQDSDWDWHRAAQLPGDQLRGEWREAVARTDRILDGVDSLDTLSTGTLRDGESRISLRWLLLHLIEEYGRHCGHADLLAEAADGRTGE